MLSDAMKNRQAKQKESLRKKAFALCSQLELSTEARYTINFSINGVRSFTETSAAQFRNLVTFLDTELRAKKAQSNSVQDDFLASF